MSDNVMKGNHIRGRLRAPRTYDEDRRCAHKGCTTTLSKYNRREHCYAHAPTRFPRLRGRVLPET